MGDKSKIKFGSMKELAISMAAYTSGSIFGPLIVFGLIGYFLDEFFGTNPKILLVSILAAFVATMFLIFKKIVKLMKYMEKMIKPVKKNANAKVIDDKSIIEGEEISVQDSTNDDINQTVVNNKSQ